MFYHKEMRLVRLDVRYFENVYLCLCILDINIYDISDNSINIFSYDSCRYPVCLFYLFIIADEFALVLFCGDHKNTIHKNIVSQLCSTLLGFYFSN